MRPLTQMHARKAAHAHAGISAHDFFFFAEAVCWDGDRGLAVGRQTADAVLWHQTFQFGISLSCLLTLPLSCTRANTRARMYPRTQQRSFPLILLPKLKDFEGLTQPGEHAHTSIFPSTEKWIQFHQPLLKRALRDAQPRFLCELKIIPNISFPF